MDTIWPLESENSTFPGDFCNCFCNGQKSEGSHFLMAKKSEGSYLYRYVLVERTVNSYDHLVLSEQAQNNRQNSFIQTVYLISFI